MGRQRYIMREPARPVGRTAPQTAGMFALISLGVAVVITGGWLSFSSGAPVQVSRASQDLAALANANGWKADLSGPLRSAPTVIALAPTGPLLTLPEMTPTADRGVASSKIARVNDWSTSSTHVRRGYGETLTWLSSVNWVGRPVAMLTDNPWAQTAK